MIIISEVQTYDDLIGPRYRLRWFFYFGLILFFPLASCGVGVTMELIVLLCVFATVMIGLPVMIVEWIWPARRMLPRTVSLMPDTLVVATAGRPRTIPLRNCFWYLGSTVEESPFFNRRKSVVIVLPGRKRVAVGLTDQAVERWRDALTASPAIRMCDRDGSFRDMTMACLYALIGATAALIVGVTAQTLLPKAPWTSADTFCLSVSGAFSGLAVASVRRFPYLGRSVVYAGSLAVYGTMGFLGGLFSGRDFINGLVMITIYQVIGLCVSISALWLRDRGAISPWRS